MVDVEVPVICGPTAAGKSGIALWLASRLPVTIISADSRQVYRSFDIGTAKPTRAEQAAVPHRGIDMIEPTERSSAAAWADAAAEWVAEARADGRIPLVVGGTGLYLRSLFEGLFEEPPLDAGARRSLAAVLDAFSLDELRRWTEQLDPPRSRFGRAQLLRAIEIAMLTGRRLSDLHRERGRISALRPRYLVVDPGPPLAGRIDARVDDMLDHGWIEEVERLIPLVPDFAPAWNATGYSAVRALVRGETTRSAARTEILIRTRQYAKRQRTWFRHQLPPALTTRLDPGMDDAPALALAWVNGVMRGGRE